MRFGDAGAFLFKQIAKESDDIVGIPIEEDTKLDIVIVTKKDVFLTEPVRNFYNFIKENIQ